MKNGFFQLVHKEDGTYVKLIPPQGGGKPLSMNELREYLEERRVAYDKGVLIGEWEEPDTEKLIRLSDEITSPCPESYSLYVSADKMMAVARFYAPSFGAEKMTAEELAEDLKFRKIKFGICSENIRKFFEDKSYCQDIVVAQGKPYTPGVPAKIEYMFSTQRKAKPTLREDGSVDFHNLNTISPCKKGELLAKLIPAQQGKKGRNVRGEELVPPKVKDDKLRFGKDISLSEDRLAIYSKVNGHVTLINGQVFVSNLLELENVDVSTGDIEYDGSILINGNVFSGYTVKATGDIEIRGVVEGARVEAGGNISIARGMNGMSKGVLMAKGHIVSKFLENAEVSANGYVAAEAILHSKVQAGTEIQVTGRKGFITGGKVMASNKVSVKTLGSSMGASTVVTVGIDPELKNRQSELLRNMQDIRREIASIEPVIMAVIQKKQKNIFVTDDQMEYVRRLATIRQEKKRELDNIYIELEDLDDILVKGEDPAVEVSEEVYPGTKICILDVSMVVKNNIKFSRFIRSEGEVKIVALN